MPQRKKFGTFGGVFTPAILTILGVIMYLRLPWIVGQAGLYMTIGIIVVAHVISVTTGLSVASISTDKRVKTGGTYYMISRSLGLPIGGTLGLALFVGLSFSVSLYLIGFSESFLGFWGIAVTKNSIRVAGTAALVGVTVITFISTNLALKTQFFILLAIGLSLGSIFLGKPATVPSQPLLYPVAGSASFIVLFGILFPAVTGFEAGVSMSGDLADPKKSIPVGTITAIFFGLAVYIGMSVFFSMRVPSAQLTGNPNVLLDISFFSPLVLAGIWGATLSSALGSILGAPRILQAISIDRITPRVFGRGFGSENEPRNALLLTFLIAEAGILVGELDVIARVVSMFFITTYGFLNMSCAIENWASPDFRPDFRIPKGVSILGAVTCLVVMIQLDLLAMIGATLLLVSLFFYLKRKELTLESGDTWEGVWSSVIREGLNRLNRNKGQQRNWRPNIILFSGSTTARPYLLDLGKKLVYKRGILSNFDLVQSSDSKIVFRKWEQSVKTENKEFEGVFARQVECNDIYSTMETISKFYGFSGLEPNTVMMGWGRNSNDPERFVNLIDVVSRLDYNLMLLSYDEKRGFGDHRRIDVWWRGKGNMAAFAFALCRFLTGSDEWRAAEVRFLLATEDSSLTEKLLENMNQIIMEYRIDAVVKVINNAVERRPFYEIIERESRDSDLIINGIPKLSKGEEQLYVTKTNAVLEKLGTVLLISASSFFEDMDIGLPFLTEVRKTVAEGAEKPARLKSHADTTSLSEAPANALRRLENLLATVGGHFRQTHHAQLANISDLWIRDIAQLVQNAYRSIEKASDGDDAYRSHRSTQAALGSFLFQVRKLLTEKSTERLDAQKEAFEGGLKWVLDHTESIPGGVPERTVNILSGEALSPLKSDGMPVRISKAGKRLYARLSGREATRMIRFREHVVQYLNTLYLELWLDVARKHTLAGLQTYPDIQRLVDRAADSIGNTGTRILDSSDNLFAMIAMEQERLAGEFERAVSDARARFDQLLSEHEAGVADTLDAMVGTIRRFDSDRSLVSRRKTEKLKRKLIRQIEAVPEVRNENNWNLLNTAIADLEILILRNRVATMIRRNREELLLNIQSGIMDGLERVIAYLEERAANPAATGQKPVISVQFQGDRGLIGIWDNQVEEIRDVLGQLPETVAVTEQESLRELTPEYLTVVRSTALPFRRLLSFRFETDFIVPVDEAMEELALTAQKLSADARDIVRLISLDLDNPDERTADMPMLEGDQYQTTALSSALERALEIKTRVETLKAGVGQVLPENLNRTFEKLNLFSLMQVELSRDSKLEVKRENRVLLLARAATEKVTTTVSRRMTAVLYRRTSLSVEDIPAAGSQRPEESAAAQILNLVESASPRPETLSGLPFYYQHLFLGKPSISKEFRVGQQEELKRGERAIQRFRTGRSGGLAVIGRPGSGKTALSQSIASRLFDQQKTFFLSPPEEGTSDLNKFRYRVQSLFNKQESPDRIFRTIPENSVFVIDNLAGWWTRDESGDAVLGEIVKLIERHGDRCFFIVNIDEHAWSYINQLYQLEDSFLDVIHCPAFDIPSLKEIIMLRHRSTGLNFLYDGQKEDEMNEWQMARMFTGLLKHCRGNVNAALFQWLRSINDVSRTEIKIARPLPAEKSALKLLDADSLILLTQFLLLGGMSSSRLGSMMRLTPEQLNRHLGTLKRYGLLTASKRGVYRVNDFIKLDLLDLVQARGLL